MADRIGQQFGNYRLVRLLGKGGFAEVYLGEHIHLGTQAAIKLLTADLTGQEKEQFRNEARLIAHLEHDHIVPVLEFDFENTIPFLVMKYAPKGTLRDRHPKGTQVPLSIVVSYIKQIAEALQYAHVRKIIHRDIKPQNILLGPKNEIWLSDFGIAAIAHNTASLNTQSYFGTPHYSAPEQIQNKPRPASDQYALGIVVYEWLTGSLPFSGDIAQVIHQHLSTVPSPLREKNSSISAEIDTIVLKALEKKIENRFESVQAFAAALEKAFKLPGEEFYLEHVSRAIRECYYQSNKVMSKLGVPKEICQEDATVQMSPQKTFGHKRTFTHGAIYWSGLGGTQPVWRGFSKIHEREGGAQGVLGFPLTPSLPAEPSPQGTKGSFQRFEGQWNYPEDINTTPVERCGATLYCSEQYGTHPTWGGIGICYERQWGTAGALGFPTSDEIDVGPSHHRTKGKCQHFEGGTIYWSWKTEAHRIKGEIAKLHDSLNGVGGKLGFPLSNEATAHPSPQETTGTFQRFEGGLYGFLSFGDESDYDGWDYDEGISVYSSKYGTYPVWGEIRICYESLGNTGGVLGFPISSETEAAKSPQGTRGWYQRFEGGIIFWCKNYGGMPVVGSFLALYDEFGGTEGRFGFPKSPEKSAEKNPKMLLQEFEGGVICILH